MSIENKGIWEGTSYWDPYVPNEDYPVANIFQDPALAPSLEELGEDRAMEEYSPEMADATLAENARASGDIYNLIGGRFPPQAGNNAPVKLPEAQQGIEDAEGDEGPPIPPHIAAAMAAAPQKMTLRGRTSSYTSPEISKNDAAIARMKLATLEEESRREAEDTSAYDSVRKYLKSRKGVNSNKLIRLEEEKAYIDSRINDLQTHIDKGVVDPFKKLPVASQIMSMIAVTLGSVGSAMTNGRVQNTALIMFEKGMARDLAMQRANIANSLKMLNISSKTKKDIMSRMLAVEKDQRDNAYKALELDSLRRANKAKDLAARRNYIEFGLKISAKAKGRQTTQTSTREVPVPKGVGSGIDIKALDPASRRSVGEISASVQNLKNLYDQLKDYKGKKTGVDLQKYVLAETPFVSKYTKAGALKAYANSLALNFVKAANGGKPSTPDYLFLRPNIPGSDESLDQIKYKLGLLKKGMATLIKQKIKANKVNFDVRAARMLYDEIDAIKFD